MSTDRSKLATLGSAVVLRLVLFHAFSNLPDLLTGRVEVSTPVTSFKRLKEGLFLYDHNTSPYDGGIFHQAPLLLTLFSQLGTSQLATSLFYTFLDVLNANALNVIAESGEAYTSRLFISSRKDARVTGGEVSAGYLFNPFTVASCIGRPTSVLTNSAIIHAVSNAVQGNTFNALFALAVASYLSMYPILLLPPLALLCWDRHLRSSKAKTSSAKFGFSMCGIFLGSIALLLWTSFALLGGSWEFLSSTYGFHLLVPDLTPNSGLWWYFLIEIFDPFREFFLGVFWLHLVGYVGGLTIRIRSQPLLALTTLLGIFAIFKPYPSVIDVSLFLAFLPLYKHIFPLMRYTFIAASTLLYATLLGPAFYHLWIYAGSGNANFFYAITLVWSLGLTILTADFLFAGLRDEWEVERPEMKDRDVKQI